MNSLSNQIVLTNVKYRLEYIIYKISGKSISSDSDFLQSIRKRLAKDISVSKVLDKLRGEIPTKIPFFKNKSSTVYRSVVSVNGYPFDVVKSGLQKYARRGYLKKCVYMIFEGLFFSYLDGGKASYTNFKNRIKVIVLEDIGVSSPHTIYEVNNLLKKIDDKEDIFCTEWIDIAYHISRTLHSRLFSHIRAYYFKYPPEEKKCREIDIGEDRDVFGIYVDNLWDCLENDNLACYWWIDKIENNEQKIKIKRHRSNRNGFLVFDILIQFIKKEGGQETWRTTLERNLEICMDWYRNLKIKEATICLFYPVYMYLLRDKINFSFIMPDLEDRHLEKYFKYNLTNNRLALEEYVYDMHTRVGRANNKNATDFACEGSLCAFEDTIVDSKFKDEYIRSKLAKDPVHYETDEFKFKVRTQLTCSKNNPDVYFAKDKLGQNVVVKGPYSSFEKAHKIFQLSRILSLFSKINYMEMNVKIMIPDRFPSVPLGIRNKLDCSKPHYFIVMKDLFNMDEYPVVNKSSKLWLDEPVVNFDELFKNKKYGIASPSKMTEKGRLSLIYQFIIRYTFEMGDFAARNFIRVKDLVYNIDIEGIFIGQTLRLSVSDKGEILGTYSLFEQEIKNTVNVWLNNDDMKWCIIQRTLGLTDIKLGKIRTNLEKMRDSFGEWLI